MSFQVKRVGNRIPLTDPGNCLARAGRIIAEADRLVRQPKPRGFVFKAQTWDEYENWKKQQTNPRLW